MNGYTVSGVRPFASGITKATIKNKKENKNYGKRIQNHRKIRRTYIIR